MKKFLKVFFIIVAVILVILLIHTIRNFTIITQLQENIKPYSSSTNYYLKTTSTQTGSKTSVEYFKKNDKQKVIQQRILDGSEATITMYDNGEKIASFYDTPTDKFVKYNMPSVISANITSFFEGLSDTVMSKIWLGITLKIQKTEVNGKVCYAVSPLIPQKNFVNIEYIEKDTGLCIKSIMGDMVAEKEYEFDNVNDEVFTEPDISQYRVEEEN